METKCDIIAWHCLWLCICVIRKINIKKYSFKISRPLHFNFKKKKKGGKRGEDENADISNMVAHASTRMQAHALLQKLFESLLHIVYITHFVQR